LFSTTFFDFQAGADGRIVSTWLWLYFVVATILSTLILTWWYVTSHRKVHKIDDTFGAGVEGIKVSQKAGFTIGKA
jgi:hypothetical protein